jgi:hypothetical protein
MLLTYERAGVPRCCGLGEGERVKRTIPAACLRGDSMLELKSL